LRSRCSIVKNDIYDIIIAMKIHVLALDGAFDIGLAAVLDTFTTANELAELQGQNSLRFDVSVVGMRRKVRTSQGLNVPVAFARADAQPDWVVVPAIGYKTPDPLRLALGRPDIADAARALRRWSERGARTAAACVGTFVLAESGLLDHEVATTTWWLASLFHQRYPNVRLDASRMVVASGRVVTAGAALSHIDLALWLVRQASPELAALVARYLIVDSRPTQSAYVITDHLAHDDPLVTKFERWSRARMAHGFSLDEASRVLGTSKRTLARRIAEALGKSPLAYFQDLRVEQAVHLLKTSNASVDEIAAAVGYAEGVTLRALLRRRLGRGVREIRGVE
jgi:transcriptional regulator GlxA family with amidase domain